MVTRPLAGQSILSARLNIRSRFTQVFLRLVAGKCEVANWLHCWSEPLRSAIELFMGKAGGSASSAESHYRALHSYRSDSDDTSVHCAH